MPGVLSDQEIKDNNFLLCRTFAGSDITIQENSVDESEMIPPSISPVRVEKLNNLGNGIMQMFLKLPGEKSFNFFAGQYIEFILNDGSRRAFSMASSPNDELIELHIRQIDGGSFTNHIFNDMNEKSIHRIEGPLGSFYLRDLDLPIIFVCGGTGFAPIKSIINDMKRNQDKRKIYLYRGVRTKKDLYQNDEMKMWENSELDISIKTVYSDADENGRERKFVHQEVVDDFKILNNFQVYCCGGPAMVDAAYQAFTQNLLLKENFFSDAFTFASTK